MSTLTATANDAIGGIELTLTQDQAVTSIVRSNNFGSATVRAAAGQFPTPATGTTVVTDYEAAQGLNSYTAYHADGTTATAAASLVVEAPWLLVPIAPNYSEQVATITDYSAGRSTASTVHAIIGRPDPVVVLGKLGTRTGSLDVFTASLADAARVVRVFDRGEVVMLKQSVPGLDMYLVAQDLSVAPYSVQGEEDTRYKLTVRYQEVIRPSGDLAGALGWTFDQMALEYSTFDSITANFASFDDLTLKDTI